ncbi:hypothetical protein F8M41_012396 [Gigaspora margarita]|uniref:Uncharacterized protein n=1 Tax=Gigaspora margarita TaxID=4874 RepID=A0A8H3WY22_GIGMA|nr:hypothetical protein F8M41_012396 [Gigaspora margarita]
MSTQKLGKSAKMSAKRCEAFLKMTAGSGVPQLDTERATTQPIETISTGSHYSLRPSNVDRLEQKISNIDSHMLEGLNLLNKTKFVKQTCAAIAK